MMSFPFQKLPLEIRRMVYRSSIVFQNDIESFSPLNPRNQRNLSKQNQSLPLLHTSRSIYLEAQIVLFNENMWRFDLSFPNDKAMRFWERHAKNIYHLQVVSREVRDWTIRNHTGAVKYNFVDDRCSMWSVSRHGHDHRVCQRTLDR